MTWHMYTCRYIYKSKHFLNIEKSKRFRNTLGRKERMKRAAKFDSYRDGRKNGTIIVKEDGGQSLVGDLEKWLRRDNRKETYYSTQTIIGHGKWTSNSLHTDERNEDLTGNR